MLSTTTEIGKDPDGSLSQFELVLFAGANVNAKRIFQMYAVDRCWMCDSLCNLHFEGRVP